MHRFALYALFAACAFAQGSDPSQAKPAPPAEVDAALKERVQLFFDLHIARQFRKAEELVAEDTKDLFYARGKPTYLSCTLVSVDYSEDLAKADAVMRCEQYIQAPGFTDKPLKLPVRTTWKMEDGKWMFYVDPESLRNSPMGKLSATPPKVGSAPPALPPIPTSTDFVFKQVQLDRNEVSLKPGETAQLTISNEAPGMMSLSVPKALPGVEATLDPSALPAGGKATLTLRAAKGAKSGVLNVQVEPTQQLLPIRVAIVE